VSTTGRVDIKFIIGIGISFFFLFILFRKIDLQQLLTALKTVDYRFLTVAVLVTLVSYSSRAVRWHYLILPQKRAKPGNLLSATIICYMANNLLPARLGEFARAIVFAKKEKLEVSRVFASLVIDRLFDGFSVLVILVFTFFTVKLPPGMEDIQKALVAGGYVTLAVYLAVIAFLVLLKRSTARTVHFVALILKPFPKVVAEKAVNLLISFISGLQLPSKSGDLLAVILSSVFIWSTAALPIDLVLQAFNIHLPFTASLFILVFLVFAVMVPASPGYVGTYHAACMYGLMAFAIPREQALSVALVVHAIGFFPVILFGFYFLWKDKISFSALKSIDTDKE
jgi:uncharacterized protein (TIRG00374 family)